jgi:epoxyqueuosine reductase
MMISTNELSARVMEYGASFCGVANLASATSEIKRQGGVALAKYPRAISIGVRLPTAIVDRINEQQDRAAMMSYRHHGYDVINRRLDDIASKLASHMQMQGYEAFPVAASQTIDEDNYQGIFSHKLAANLAGLGWIGKSCLLVTPDAGPRVRWATVLTDAPIEPVGVPIANLCGSCSECVDICPVDAFTGKNFDAAEPRAVRFDAQKCRNHQVELGKQVGVNLCGLCLYVCPNGRGVE